MSGIEMKDCERIEKLYDYCLIVVTQKRNGIDTL